MLAQRLVDFLQDRDVKYVRIQHSTAYTAPEVAHSAHVSGKDLAKTVLVKIDDQLAMAVLPANLHVDLERLREAADASSVHLATEEEFGRRFPDCELGAMPPFGHLYDMPVFVAEALTQDEAIAFNAGSNRELFQLPYADFDRLEGPRVVDFAI